MTGVKLSVFSFLSEGKELPPKFLYLLGVGLSWGGGGAGGAFVKFSVSMREPPMPTHQGELCLLKLSGCGTRTF